MTVYNRRSYLPEAISSVICSDYADLELIVSDDASTDNSLEIAREFARQDSRIKVFAHSQNVGDYRNRNQAAKYASGKYLKYVDADDCIYRYTLGILVGYMEMFPEAGFGLSSEASEDRPFPICIPPAEIYREHFAGFGHFNRSPGSAIIKREAFEALGGFSGERMIGDYEFWLKMARYHALVKYPHGIYWNRQHPDQESKTAYARKNYRRLKEAVLGEALKHKDLPIGVDEIQQLISDNRHPGLMKRLWKKLKA